MLVIQNLVNFSVAGNKQNPFSITLYFASGTVPEDLDADVYYDEERTAIASLKPVFETITTRTDAARMIISGEQMLAASEYSLLYLEISYGGMVQTRGTLKADSRTETTPRQDYFKLHTFGGDEIGVAISESLTQALDIQADVTAKLGEVTQLKADTVQLKADTAQLKADTQTLKADTLQARTDTAQLKADTQTLKADTLQARTDTLQAKADTLQAKTDTLQAKADTQTLKADTTQLKADTLQLKADTLQLKDDAVTAKDGAVAAKNDAVAAKNSAQQSAQLASDNLTEILQIATDFTGWIPVFGLVTDGARVVVKVTDWAGGHGTKPAINVYLGATGPVTDIAQAVDIRGPIGFNWMGDHSTGTPYAIGDAFVFRGSAYRVNVAFTGAFDRSKVTRILRGTNPVGAWTATTQYYIDDLVTDSGNTYRRLTDGVSGASFSGIGADWAMWAQKGDPGTLTASAFAVAASYDLVNHLVVVQKGTTLEKMTRNALLDFSSVGLPAVRPTLMVDFANSRFVSPRVSFARSGTGAARYNAVRKFESIGANIPRIDYGRATGKCLGLLGEFPTTNYSAYAVVPSQWGSAGATKTDNVVLAPDGSLAPTWTNTPNVGSSFFTGVTTGFVMAANTDYTYSFHVYLVSATSNSSKLVVTEINLGATSGRANFDLYNLTATKTANITAASMEDAGDGWYRCIVTFRTDATGTPGVVRNYIGAYGSTPETVTVSGWGSDLEPLPYATTLVPNTGLTAGVRNAETPRILTDASWFNAKEGTIIVDAIFPVTLPNSNQGIISFNDGSMSNRLEIRANSHNTSAGGVVQNSPASVSYSLGGVLNRYALSYKAGKTAVCRNGGTVATAATATIPTITQLSLCGVDGGNANGRIWLPKLEYYPMQFSDSLLQASSAI